MGIIAPCDVCLTAKLSYPERASDLGACVTGMMVGHEKICVTARG